MNELKTTILFGVTAAVLATAAMVIDPGAATPDVFSDQGEAFYPDFTDPQAPKAIEVVDYDEATATARPLKVEFAEGTWRVPSHFNYPADAEDRLANTAAALMELRKDAIVSDRVEEHGDYGVIDPFAEGELSLEGRGQRVTLKDENDATLADFIVGRKVDGKPNRRYMRVPTQKRVYEVETSADVSAKFEDWIETDLLKTSAGDIRRVLVNRYSINERMGRLENQERLVLTKKDDKWTMSGGGAPDTSKMNDLTGALDSLKIVDVQPKPQNLTEVLKGTSGIAISRQSQVSLRRKVSSLRGGVCWPTKARSLSTRRTGCSTRCVSARLHRAGRAPARRTAPPTKMARASAATSSSRSTTAMRGRSSTTTAKSPMPRAKSWPTNCATVSPIGITSSPGRTSTSCAPGGGTCAADPES